MPRAHGARTRLAALLFPLVVVSLAAAQSVAGSIVTGSTPVLETFNRFYDAF